MFPKYQVTFKKTYFGAMLYTATTQHLTETTASQNESALSNHSVRRLNFLAVVFVAAI